MVLGSKEGEFEIGNSGHSVGYFRRGISVMTEKCPLHLKGKKSLVTLFRVLSVGGRDWRPGHDGLTSE